MSDYLPIPVAEAKSLGDRYDKSIVIVFAWDPTFELIHTTTYGKSVQDKEWAAKGGEIATAALGGEVLQKLEFEDYRILRIRELEAEVSRLHNLLKMGV